MREAVTTGLDVLGLLLVAGGAARAAYPYVGWWSVALAGVVVLAAVRVAERTGRRGESR